MLMKIEHGNLRTAPAPLPGVARATSPTRWATCPAEDRDRQIGVPARPSGWGQLSTTRPFFTRPRKIENWEMRAGALWRYLILFFTPFGKKRVKKQHALPGWPALSRHQIKTG